MVTEREKPRPTFSQKAFGALACFGQEHFTHRPIVEGLENLEQANAHLQEGSVIFYFNHRSLLDPDPLFKLLKSHLPNLKLLVAATSYRHLDPKRADYGPIDGLVMKGVASKRGVILLPVIQHYDMDAYPPDVVTAVNYRFVKEGLRTLKTPGGALFISPEGTRSKRDQLLPAQEGIELFLERSEKAATQPIALMGTRLSQAIFEPPRVIIGPLYSREAVLEKAQNDKVEVKDALMIFLAELLPPENRGAYARYY